MDNLILAADGSITLKVTEIGEGFVKTECQNAATLGERKNMNLPGVKVDLPVLQEKDKEDIVKFGIPNGVDFVAASFVQSAADVKFIRQILGLRGRSIKIVSKIENEEGESQFLLSFVFPCRLPVCRASPSSTTSLSQMMTPSLCIVHSELCNED